MGVTKIFACRQNRLKAFTLRFDRSEYFDRAHVRGLGFLVWDTVVFGAYEEKLKVLIAEMKKEIAEIKANAKNEG